MPDITTFLTYNDQAEEAARFYTSIFPNSRVTKISHYPELEELPMAGGVMMVEFELMGRKFLALNGGPQFSFTQGFSLSVLCDTQQEVDEYWAKLAAEGREVACGWVTDKYGVSWQIQPKLLVEMVTDADPEKAKKAMKAMLGMVKIDSDALRKAWQ